MIPVLTPEEMHAADARTIAAGTPEAVLMQRAGRAVAWRVRQVLGGTYGRRVVVVCGKGNNGGDGRITGAALSEWGVRVDVVNIAELSRIDAEVGHALDPDETRDQAWARRMSRCGRRGPPDRVLHP